MFLRGTLCKSTRSMDHTTKQKQAGDIENRKLDDSVRGEKGSEVANTSFESWRIFKIMAEFVSGFELLRKYGLAATFFGSARCGVGDKYYEAAALLASRLVADGYAIITGGGSGIMEASNRGAYEAKGKSIGLNIQLPREQILNRFLTDSFPFHYFFTRKVMLSYASEVYIYFPGGFGTLDEFFELATLVQTKKIAQVPIILYGRSYWDPLTRWIRSEVYERFNAIDREDMEIYHVVDSVDEAMAIIGRLVDKNKQKEN